MIFFPPCKINLGLHVVSKRPDGYHNLETCFYPIPFTDILEIIPSTQFSFTSSGIDIPGDRNENLCVKAYHLLAKDFKLPRVSIHVHKIIPAGAGLGGGSSDAAYTLRLLNEVFNLKLGADSLSMYASQLGSDCTFFTHNAPKLGTGRGEVLDDISVSLKGKFLLLVKPDVHVSTAEAYAGVHPKQPLISLREILERKSMKDWKSILRNDFEESIFKKYPAIEALKQKLYSLGAVYASMSGSGASVFGIFDREVNLRSEFEGSFCWSGVL